MSMQIPYHVRTEASLSVASVRLGDAQELYSLIDASRSDLLNLEWAATETLQGTIDWIDIVMVGAISCERDAGVIRVNGAIAGMIEVRRLENCSVQLGYWLGTEFRGKGIMQTAAKFTVDYHATGHAVVAKIRNKNVHSEKILRHCGLTPYARDTSWTYFMRKQDLMQ